MFSYNIPFKINSHVHEREGNVFPSIGCGSCKTPGIVRSHLVDMESVFKTKLITILLMEEPVVAGSSCLIMAESIGGKIQDDAERRF